MKYNDKLQEEWDLYEEAIDQFIQSIAKNMNLYGITSSVGRLYGTLYFSENPMTLDDMQDALQMSKTSMSTGIRHLASKQMVKPVFKKGERKDLYEAEENWYKSFNSLFSRQWKQQTSSNIEEANEAITRLEKLLKSTNDPQLKTTIDQNLNRLYYAKDYYKWLMQFIEVVESGKIFELIPISSEHK